MEPFLSWFLGASPPSFIPAATSPSLLHAAASPSLLHAAVPPSHNPLVIIAPKISLKVWGEWIISPRAPVVLSFS